jgi:hypothetical protein
MSRLSFALSILVLHFAFHSIQAQPGETKTGTATISRRVTLKGEPVRGAVVILQIHLIPAEAGAADEALRYAEAYASGPGARLRRGPDKDGSGARRGANPAGDFRRDGSGRFRRLDRRGAGRLHGDREGDDDQDQGRQMKQVPCAVHREGRDPRQMRASFKRKMSVTL